MGRQRIGRGLVLRTLVEIRTGARASTICDHYTIRVGQGPAFARSLRRHALPYERPIRWMSFSVASHPYTKQRMARLEGVPGETAGDGV